MSYKVTLRDQADHGLCCGGTPKFYMSRSQAIHAMRKLAYDKLESFGKLDTVAAHNVMAEIKRCDDILPPQDQRTITISNTRYTLTISNTARTPR